MSEKLVINGYELEAPLTTKDAGFSEWGFGYRDGCRYFIKEFLSPVYPSNDSGLSEGIIRAKRAACEQFQNEKNELYNCIRRCRTGNIIPPEHFFRADSRYYIATECVDSVSNSVETLCRAHPDIKRMIFRLLSYNFSVLHRNGVIHSDVKPSNIMIKPTTEGYLTAKIVDFDSSFLITKPPAATDDVHGDLVYLAPEVFLRMRDEEGELTEKLDIFSLGILFHEFWCGHLPAFDGNYAFEAVLTEKNIGLDTSIPEDIRDLIRKMISLSPEDRPSAEECYAQLGGADYNAVAPVMPGPGSPGTGSPGSAAPDLAGGSPEPAPEPANSFMKRAGDL